MKKFTPILFSFWCATMAAAAPYDDFDTSLFLDRARWLTPEVTRLVTDGRLLSEVRGRNATSLTRFAQANTINAIASTVTVNRLDTTGNATARARVAGYFCDSNNASDDGNQGEIYAEAAIQNGTTGALIFRYSLSQCSVQDCSESLSLYQTVFGTPQLNTDYTLAVAYDPATVSFSFAINGADSVSVSPVDVPALANCGPTNSAFKALGTGLSGAATAADSGVISVTFDDALVDGALYDDFSNPLTSTQWLDRERKIALEVEDDNTVLRAVQRFIGTPRGVAADLANPSAIEALRADVRIDNTEIVSPDNNVETRARVSGHFYNDGTSSRLGDLTGDVFAEINLSRITSDTGNINQIVCRAKRSDDAEFNTGSSIFIHRFDMTWDPGQTYRLALGFDAARGTFTCDADAQRFTYTLETGDPQPVAPPANGNVKSVGTRIVFINADAQRSPGRTHALNLTGGDDDSASISAVFDNVEVLPAAPGGGQLFSSGFETFPDF